MAVSRSRARPESWRAGGVEPVALGGAPLSARRWLGEARAKEFRYDDRATRGMPVARLFVRPENCDQFGPMQTGSPCLAILLLVLAAIFCDGLRKPVVCLAQACF